MTVAGGAWLTLPKARPFYEALIEYGELGAWEPLDMLTLITGECDLILMDHPNAHGYEGLTQIGKNELRALGWDAAERGPFCKAPPEVQIQFTARYFAGWRKRLGIPRWESPGHLWAANLAPAHLTRVDGVVYDEITHPKQVAANRWLDLNRDGVITRDELTTALLTKAIPRCQARFDLARTSLESIRSAMITRPMRAYVANAQPAAIVERERKERG